jgi:putative flippase GtrA
VLRFAGVGLLSTIAYLVLYAALREPAGAQSANAVALLLTTLANTAANRRITFGVTGSDGAVRHQAQGLLVFGLALGLTSGTLAILNAAAHPGRALEMTALVAANLVATLLRFVLLRGWVFRRYATAERGQTR